VRLAGAYAECTILRLMLKPLLVRAASCCTLANTAPFEYSSWRAAERCASAEVAVRHSRHFALPVIVIITESGHAGRAAAELFSARSPRATRVTFTLGAISGQNAPISSLDKNVPIRIKQTYQKPGTPKPGTHVFLENPAQIARTISSDSVGIE